MTIGVHIWSRSFRKEYRLNNSTEYSQLSVEHSNTKRGLFGLLSLVSGFLIMVTVGQ